MYPLVSIIITTLNSDKTITRVLDSIQVQDYPKDRIEVLIYDAGSTDRTRDIIQKYNYRVIDNPRILPTWAKYFGYQEARGKYLMFLDSDEVVKNRNSLSRKIRVLESRKNVYAITGSGYESPREYPFLNRYINEFGDPFSFFIYRLSKDYKYYLNDIKHRYQVIEESEDYLVTSYFNTKKLPIIELVAMGSVINLQYIRKNLPEIRRNPEILSHIFYLLISKESYIAILKNDIILHYSSNTYKRYLGKLSSRVIYNIFTPGIEGYSGRNRFFNEGLRNKKYLFLPYALSFIMPLIDSVCLIISRHSIGYIIHVPLTVYTALLIIYYKVLKLLNYTPILKSYGNVKVIS